MTNTLSRRELLGTFGGAVALASLHYRNAMAQPASMRRAPDIGGAVMIMTTPYAPSGDVEYEDLAREVRFLNECGTKSFVWGQLEFNLTQEQRFKAMEVVAKANQGQKAKFGLGAQGRDTAEMLEVLRHAESLNPDMIISRPPNSGTTQDDVRAYYTALAKATKRPVIIQTGGGSVLPSVELLVQLAREFPNFGYLKEESTGNGQTVVERQIAECHSRPPLRSVMSANYALGWLYEMRIGVDGVVTESGMFADVLTRMWDLHLQNKTDDVLDAYAKYMLIRRVPQIGDIDLYFFKKRRVFKPTTTLRRENRAAPPELTPLQTAELDARFAALRPYLSGPVGDFGTN
jgi:dihydrodipicolinate synthase/N-acetylneuraminate lyase